MYSSDLETASAIGQVPDSPKYRLDVEAAASSGSTSFQEQSSHSWWALARTVTAFFFIAVFLIGFFCLQFHLHDADPTASEDTSLAALTNAFNLPALHSVMPYTGRSGASASASAPRHRFVADRSANSPRAASAHRVLPLLMSQSQAEDQLPTSGSKLKDWQQDEKQRPDTSKVNGFDFSKLRADFPILDQKVNGMPLVYLDSAATSQKPNSVLKAMDQYYRADNANVHRGAHALAGRATEAYERTRDLIAGFVNARSREEIVYTRGASEAINLVAATWGETNIHAGDVIILSLIEHHSNLVPWQLLAKRKGATLDFVGIDQDESYDVEGLQSLLKKHAGHVKLVGLGHVSNMLGSEAPVKEVTRLAHAAGAKVLVDACQSVPTQPVDVQDIDCDFLVASGHKMLGPTGVGFLYGKFEVLEKMPPYQGGGEMIDEVYLDHSTFLPPPARFEAGTPAIAPVVGLGTAIEYLQSIGMINVQAHEKELAAYLESELAKIEGIRIYGPRGSKRATALVAFNYEGIHAADLAFFLDQEGVACRAGHHCTQPLHRHFGAAGSLRASMYVYNTKQEVDEFIKALRSSLEMLGVAPFNQPDGVSGGAQPSNLLLA